MSCPHLDAPLSLQPWFLVVGTVGHQALAVCYGHTDAHRFVVPLTYLCQLALPMCVASDPDSELGAQLHSTP